MNYHRQFLLAFITLALLYAGLAGLRTVGDSDLGWQLATGRYVVEHRTIPSQDVFSYTAQGREWIYPPFSGVLFYGLYAWGGFAALSWLSAAACVATVLVLVSSGGGTASRIISASLAIIAVPFVASRTKVRSDLFSTFLFAAVLVLLWRHYRGRRSPLWVLAPLMCVWTNLHLGFIAGLALLGSYVGMEVLEMASAERRSAAWTRLRTAAPWLAAAGAATLLNPWGPRLYVAIVRQNRILASLEGYVGEWFPVRFSGASVRALFDFRNPDSAYLWLLIAGTLAGIHALWRRSPGSLLLMAGTLFSSLRYIRFQALFAMVVVVVAGDLLGSRPRPPSWLTGRERPLVLGLLAAILILVGVRVSDLVSNRYYLSAVDNVVFGPGVSWWYPERAAAFVLRERLPGRIFNDYNIGGYLTFRLGPDYPVSVDGRAVPFGPELFFLHKAMLAQSPDTPQWKQQAARWGVNTVIVSVARYGGISDVRLKDFCGSPSWSPVYLDEVAAVFVLNRPENTAWVDRLRLACATAPFTPPATRNRAELYNFYANAGWVLFALGRGGEALQSLERAQRLFEDDPQLHLIKGSVLQGGGRIGDAEQEYRTSLRLRESDQAWYALGQAQAIQGRYPEAAEAIARAARYALFPHEIYRVLGEVYLAMNRPQEALSAFDEADRRSPYRDLSAQAGGPFQAQVAAGRAKAWRKLGDLPRAVSFQEQAVAFAPQDPALWLELADLYQAQGRNDSAQQARSRAQSIRSQ